MCRSIQWCLRKFIIFLYSPSKAEGLIEKESHHDKVVTPSTFLKLAHLLLNARDSVTADESSDESTVKIFDNLKIGNVSINEISA